MILSRRVQCNKCHCAITIYDIEFSDVIYSHLVAYIYVAIILG